MNASLLPRPRPRRERGGARVGENSRLYRAPWIDVVMTDCILPRLKNNPCNTDQLRKNFQNAPGFVYWASLDPAVREERFKILGWNEPGKEFKVLPLNDTHEMLWPEFLSVNWSDPWVQQQSQYADGRFHMWTQNSRGFWTGWSTLMEVIEPLLKSPEGLSDAQRATREIYESVLGFDFKTLSEMSHAHQWVAHCIWNQTPWWDSQQNEWQGVPVEKPTAQCVRLLQWRRYVMDSRHWGAFLFWVDQTKGELPPSRQKPHWEVESPSDRMCFEAPQKGGLAKELQYRLKKAESEYKLLRVELLSQLLEHEPLRKACSIEEHGVSVEALVKKQRPKVFQRFQEKMLKKSLKKVSSSNSNAHAPKRRL